MLHHHVLLLEWRHYLLLVLHFHQAVWSLVIFHLRFFDGCFLLFLLRLYNWSLGLRLWLFFLFRSLSFQLLNFLFRSFLLWRFLLWSLLLWSFWLRSLYLWCLRSLLYNNWWCLSWHLRYLNLRRLHELLLRWHWPVHLLRLSSWLLVLFHHFVYFRVLSCCDNVSILVDSLDGWDDWWALILALWDCCAIVLSETVISNYHWVFEGWIN